MYTIYDILVLCSYVVMVPGWCVLAWRRHLQNCTYAWREFPIPGFKPGIWSGGTSELPTELMHLTHYSPNIPHHLNTIIKIKWHVQPIWHTCSLFLYCYCTCMMCTCLEKASAKLYVRTKGVSKPGARTPASEVVASRRNHLSQCIWSAGAGVI